MHWQEACLKSFTNMAERECDKTGRLYLRSSDGHGNYIKDGKLHDAFPEQLEGHYDWKPECPKGGK